MTTAYKYMKDDKELGWLNYSYGRESFNWRSVCHNADVMDNYAIYLEEVVLGQNLGWAVCRRCGSLSTFVMKRN